jgi:hypothetical protein
LAALMLAGSVALAGCGGTSRVAPDTPQLNSLATNAAPQIPGIAGGRYWGDQPPQDLRAQVAEMRTQRRASGVGRPEITVLAISGGADYGAFGAGVLSGWSKTGTRPEFTVVTGISTGALTAPFAFLGPRYDTALAEVYGGLPPSSIFIRRSIIGAIANASAVDAAPLRKTIEAYATDAMLADIAREHARGRRLYVQSTSLDAQRPVIWDLGQIAASGAPNARKVFVDALMASAAVPDVFPPVLVPTVVDGRTFQELHVDGGVISQSTVMTGWQPDLLQARGIQPMRLYVIHNNRIQPEPEATDVTLVGIGGRSMSTIIKSQGTVNILEAYQAAQLNRAQFRATWIGADFTLPYVGPFDQAYMQALFAYGERRALDGKVWSTLPPQLLRFQTAAPPPGTAEAMASR